MTEAPIAATLFVYQVGFGDCFLLRFQYAGNVRRHMLIDFGTTSLPDDAAPDHMVQVARDIAAKCTEHGNSLDVVVATHRHRDHISGFATNEDGTASGDIIRGLAPKLVIQPWTESPEAPTDWEGPTDETNRLAFSRHRSSLASMHQTAGQALAFLESHGKRVPKAIADQIEFIGTDNLANESAVFNLAQMGARNAYVCYGSPVDVSVEMPGVDIGVLGPPSLRQTQSIRKQRSRDRDEFWHLAAERMETLAKGGDEDLLFPDAPYCDAGKMLVEYRWLQRRLDGANSELALGLVRALDKQMNNTSVILLLRAGGKSLLFPGDAQLENWQYALSQPSALELLSSVDLLKIGHHGSLNATPKSMWKLLAKRGPKSTKNRLISVLSTKHGKHGSEVKGTEVPRSVLVNDFEAQSELHSTEKLAPKVLYEEIPIRFARQTSSVPSGRGRAGSARAARPHAG